VTATRRQFIAGSASLAATTGVASAARAQTMVRGVFANGDRPLVAFPQKRPLLVLTPRPPQLETPFEIFDEGVFTPNDAFFVRWHLEGIPTTIDGSKFRINVGGEVDRPMSLSVADLKKFEPFEIAAVNQCSGNSRGFFEPRPAGGQWQNGAMGNARWKGVRLKDILDKAGLRASAKQVQFNGLETPILPLTPDFKKSLDVDVARGDDVMVAYEMNGAALPLLNGFPVRLVVPGWFSTYWVKMLSDITVLDHVDDQFWMKTAYRVPDTPGGSVLPTDKDYKTVPISTMKVRSFVTSVRDGATIESGRMPLRGIAFDGGSGIKTVEYSADGGATWIPALLGPDFGKYSFRRWSADVSALAGQKLTLACRAVGNDGGMQTTTPIWNPGGYMRNVIEKYEVSVA
jgi:sulfite dehydrogenase